ncbi:MAG: MnhB domain-containing protein [Candidatus Bipolaricaulia bacterium]
MRRTSVGRVIVGVLLIAAFCTVILTAFGFRGSRDVGTERWIDVARQTGAVNIVSSIYLGARLFDTLLEVLVFAVAVLGVHFYLTARGHPEPVESIPESRVVRVAADILLPLILLIGIYVTVHGHLSPGGGFSGGVIAGTGLLLAAIALGTSVVAARFGRLLLERIEWGALLGILVLAVAPVLFARLPMSDLLPPGRPGSLGSGGSILLYNGLIGVKVFIGSWVIVRHFVDHRGEI